MLQTQTIKEETFGILKTLMRDEKLNKIEKRLKEMIKYSDRIFSKMVFK
jgi:hypothetical protein